MLWFFAGAITWVISVAIKLVVVSLISSTFKKQLSPVNHATIWGITSALCELGLAALVFLFLLPVGSLWDVVAFGTGAGITEAVVLFFIALYQKGNADTKVMLMWYQRWTFVVERSGAALGHIGSRGLVWLGIHGTIFPLIIAIITFASVDGVATYGILCKWDWFEYQTWKKFYIFIVTIGLIEVLLFVVIS